MRGPHISADDIEADVGAEYAFTLGDALKAMNLPAHPSLDVMTLAVVVFSNGFAAVGTSSVVHAADFDAEAGRTFARANAIEQAWPLFGWSLREKLMNAEKDASTPEEVRQVHEAFGLGPPA